MDSFVIYEYCYNFRLRTYWGRMLERYHYDSDETLFSEWLLDRILSTKNNSLVPHNIPPFGSSYTVWKLGHYYPSRYTRGLARKYLESSLEFLDSKSKPIALDALRRNNYREIQTLAEKYYKFFDRRQKSQHHQLLKMLTDESDRLAKELDKLDFKEALGYEYVRNIDGDVDEFIFINPLNRQEVTLTIQKTITEELGAKYIGDSDKFMDYVFVCLLKYSALTGGSMGMHSALPEVLLDTLSEYGVSGELFASAFNSHLPKYLSLFSEYEHVFGSRGSMFDDDWLEKLDSGTSGFYEANPPFTYEYVDFSMDKFDVALEKPRAFGVIIFFPEQWDYPGKSRLTQHKFKVLDFHVKAREHKYITGGQFIEGKQYYKSPSDTYICILQNDLAREKWPIDGIQEDIEYYFSG